MRRQKPMVMTDEAAGHIGARALLFLAEDQRRIVRFLQDSGLDPATLSQEARSPSLLAAVLSHLLADESLLLVFTAGAGLEPADVTRAQMMLEGSA